MERMDLLVCYAIYLNQSGNFCLAPLSSFLKLIPTTFGTPLNKVAILVSPSNQRLTSKF